MKPILIAALSASLLGASAFAADPAPARDTQMGYSEVQLARYCAKLEQGVQAYASYVNRMKKMHPYYGFDDLGGSANGLIAPKLQCAMDVPMVQAKDASDPAPASAEAQAQAQVR